MKEGLSRPIGSLYVGVDEQSSGPAEQAIRILLDADILVAVIPFESRTRPAFFYQGEEYYGIKEIREAFGPIIDPENSTSQTS